MKVNKKESSSRKHLREFVNCIIKKDYAGANANLTLAVKEKMKSNVASVLQEN